LQGPASAAPLVTIGTPGSAVVSMMNSGLPATK
jgi:hypothetical protein